MSPKAKCLQCEFSGGADLFPASASPYHDLKCPKCGSTNIDTTELNKTTDYGYGNNNTLEM